MLRILVVGTKNLAYEAVKMIANFSNMQIIAIVNGQGKVNGNLLQLTGNLKIEVVPGEQLEQLLGNEMHYVIETTGDEQIMETVHTYKQKNTIIIHKQVLMSVFPLLKERNLQISNSELILNSMGDGLVVVNNEEKVQFMNEAAGKIIGIDHKQVAGVHIHQIIKNSRLPDILRHRRTEINEKIVLENGKEIITTRIPLINDKNRLVGAFATFKDSNDVLRLAEENTDLREVKTMLEAIIYSSDEAISVVDEHGNGMIINPAYTRITGLSEKDVIGKPATVDISEGKSMHLQVLKTRRPVRRVRMKVGPSKKEVIVNVAPIIVRGRLKGSVAVIHDISEIHALTNELKIAKQIIRNLEATYTFDDITGNSQEMMIAVEQAKIAAKTPATVLLRGDSGTGKELFAHAIHNASSKKYNKFIRVNCAAIAESILESELFGYEEGAFTGAKSGGKKGLFEEANHGSIFLDEIGELSLATQAKLLRVLQEKEIVKVGGTTAIPLDVRIIAATNVNLEKAITNKTFREDLYYRLSRLPIHIPSLSERMDDLPDLVTHMIQKVNQLYGRNVKTCSDEALQSLRNYHWPGNIRELENVIARAIIFMDVTEEQIKLEHLPTLELHMDVEGQHMPIQNDIDHLPLQDAVDTFEKEYIAKVYASCHFNKTATAKKLQISVRNLYYKIEKYQLDEK